MMDDELRALFFDAVLARAEEDEEYRLWAIDRIQKIKEFRNQAQSVVSI